MFAAMEGELEVARMLINVGYDINLRDSYERTALIYAAVESQFDVAQLLIESGARLDQIGFD
jgi:ankyrin repeat protein